MMKADAGFRPTELDLALQDDPVAEALRRELLAASRPEQTAAEGSTPEEPLATEPDGGQASREGQRETAAASLAGGMIAAEGRPVTPAEAVQKVKDVLNEFDR